MFSTTRMIIGATLVATVAGCGSVASTTRTGEIQEVRLGERLTASNVRIEPGDELRWINERSMPVTIELLEGAGGGWPTDRVGHRSRRAMIVASAS